MSKYKVTRWMQANESTDIDEARTHAQYKNVAYNFDKDSSMKNTKPLTINKVKKGQKVILTKSGKNGRVFSVMGRGGLVDVKLNNGKFIEVHIT